MLGRDRVLAGFLALQLLIAAVFGAVLVHALKKPVTQTVVAADGSTGAVVPGASSAAVAPGAGKTTTTVGGSQGSQGTTGSQGTGGSQGTVSSKVSTKKIAAGAPLTFGAIVTQNFSISFKDSLVGSQLYLQQLNAKGGANGHRVSLIAKDDMGQSGIGYPAAQSLISSGVTAFAGFNAPITEGYSAFKTLIDDQGIPLVGSYGESPEYKDANAFAFTSQYVHIGYENGLFLAKHGIKKPGFMYIDNTPDNDANDEIERGFKAGYKAGGGSGSPVFDKVATTNPAFDSDLSTFQQDGVDGFGSILDATGYGRLLQAQARVQYYPMHVADPLFDNPDVKKQADTKSHPVYVFADIDFLEVGGPKVQAYIAAAKAAGKTPTYLGEVGWLDMDYVAQAVDKLGASFSRADLLASLNGLSPYDNGFTHPLQIAAGFHDMNKCVKFGLITNGTLTQVQDWSCDTQQP